MLEMRLFHHYLTVTCHSLTIKPVDTHNFQILVPRLAVSYNYLLDSLLAVSALHLASIEVNETRSWLHVALKYQNQAVSGFSKALAEMSSQTCQPAFFCSVFTMLFATAYPGISQDSQSVDPLSEVLELRTLVAGCMILFTQLAESNGTDEMKAWIQSVLPVQGSNEERASLIAWVYWTISPTDVLIRVNKQKINMHLFRTRDPKLIKLHEYVETAKS